MADLINDLGGTQGFGEVTLERGNNVFSGLIDLSGVFANGLTFGTDTYTSLQVSTNGYLAFSDAQPTVQTAGNLAAFGDVPVIAALFSDIDTTVERGRITEGGNSTGENLIHYDVDTVAGIFTATWNDVGYPGGTDEFLNAFQIRLIDQSGEPGRSNGDFDIEFRFENIRWSGEEAGFGTQPAVFGLSTGGDASDLEVQFPGSGSSAAIDGFAENPGNSGEAGLWRYEVRDGVVFDPFATSTVTVSGARTLVEGDAGTQTVTYTVVRTGDLSGFLSVPYIIDGSGENELGEDDITNTLPLNGTVFFDVGEDTATISFQVLGDTAFEPTESITLTLDPLGTVTAASVLSRTVTTTVTNDDPNNPPVAVIDVFDSDEDSVITGSVFDDNGNGADTDPDGDALSVISVENNFSLVDQAVTLASGAIVTVQADGTFTYDPNGAFADLTVGQSTQDSFAYGIRDSFGNLDLSQVNLTINGEDGILDLTGGGFVAEGDGGPANLIFTVTRSGATNVSASVFYAVTGSGANPATQDDFFGASLPSGEVVFAAGETEKTIIIPVQGDLNDELDEEFTLTLSNATASAGLIGINTATADGGITDDDAPGDITVQGTNGKDKFKGTAADDAFAGLGGKNKFKGGAGDDIALGGADKDKFDGEDGDDILDAGGGRNTVKGGAGDDSLTTGDDRDKIRGEEGNDTIVSAGGDDRVRGGLGDDTILAGAGDDRVRGEDGDDMIDGGAGIDEIRGGNGSDTLRGGDGDDELQGEDGGDILFGDAGNDLLEGERGIDQLNGGAGDDTLFGGSEGDFLFGNDGDDFLFGDAGADYLEGNAGDDTLDGGFDADELHGLEGDDLLIGGAGDDMLFGGLGDDRLEGGEGSDSFFGGAGSDVYDGGGGDDTLRGEDGDLLFGGSGNDTFIFGLGDGEVTIGDFFVNLFLERDQVRGDTLRLEGYADFGFTQQDFVDATEFDNASNFRFISPFNENDVLVFQNSDFTQVLEELVIV